MESADLEKSIELLINEIKQGKTSSDLAKSFNLEEKEISDIEKLTLAVKKESSVQPSKEMFQKVLKSLPEMTPVTEVGSNRLNKQEALFDKFNNFIQETMSLKTLSYALASILIISGIIFFWTSNRPAMLSVNNQSATSIEKNAQIEEPVGDPDQEFDLLLASMTDEELIEEQELADDFGSNELDSQLKEIENIYEEI